jgi:hypothetical protein
MIEKEILAGMDYAMYGSPANELGVPTFGEERIAAMRTADPNGELPGERFVTSVIDPLADVTPQQFLRGTGETAAVFGKGLTQGFFGLPGDLESIARGLFANLDAGAVQRIQRSPAPFLRAFYELASAGIDFDTFAQGLEMDTFLPTSKDVGEAIDKLEVMPEMQRFDEAGTAAMELFGEVLAPAGYIRMGQQAGRAVKKGAQQVKKAVTKRRSGNKIQEPQQEPQ